MRTPIYFLSITIAWGLMLGPWTSAFGYHETSDDRIRVTILGTGTPIPTPEQAGAAVLVQAGGQNLLFDCGRDCTTRLAQVDRRLVTSLDQLFVTHLHSDHLVGIDDLWLNGWTLGRNFPLRVYGPEGIRQFFDHLREAFREDINYRAGDGIPATTDGIDDAVTELTEDRVIFEESGVSVTAFLVDHATVEPAFGYRVDYTGRSVVISGDTRYSANLIRHAQGADVVIHEVMSPTQIAYVESHFSESQANTIVGYHTTAEQAGRVFAAISPRLAVYYHTRNTPADAPALISETRLNFDGPLEIARDLLQITIGDEIELQMPE